uniref:Uncharacterized protein n=1 Tax=Equus asinus TaxID=9793 RepID=A0A9L0IV86_EQUAS
MLSPRPGSLSALVKLRGE